MALDLLVLGPCDDTDCAGLHHFCASRSGSTQEFVPECIQVPESRPRGCLIIDRSAFMSLQEIELVFTSKPTVTLVLLICALTFGPSEGWGSPLVIVLFTFSICLAGCFFYWETLLPVEKAVVCDSVSSPET